MENSSFQEIMLYLQVNSFYGSIIFAVQVVIFYLAIGIYTCVKSRKKGINVCALCFIPILQLIVLLLVIVNDKIKNSKNNRKSKQKVEVSLQDNSISIDSKETLSEDDVIEF